MASLTKEPRTVDVKLDFLEDGNYTAYIYKTNQDNSNVTVETMDVTNESSLKIDLLADDGVSIKITKEEFNYTTDYEDNYTYIEAEKAELVEQLYWVQICLIHSIHQDVWL
ncbi:MAG: glycoside hydrolase family 97 C-terminal domain-containing protein, partial [Lachnospiraceae bacterium]|nr:glycoside hydrolase family 97 C-terminal domain-containing protein [Lachnospiraceae bacterium]